MGKRLQKTIRLSKEVLNHGNRTKNNTMNTLEKKIEEYLLEFKKDKTYFQETKEKFMDLFTSQKNQALLEQYDAFNKALAQQKQGAFEEVISKIKKDYPFVIKSTREINSDIQIGVATVAMKKLLHWIEELLEY